MGLETGTFISDLNASNPAAGDLISAGDDHIRLLKAVIKNSFPNITGAVTVTQGELNYLSGMSSNVQAQLDGKSAAGHTHTEGEITDSDIFPRLAATEVISGSWNFTTRPQVNGNGVLDSASSIPETSIADGALLARLAANETITGNWAFDTTLNAVGMNISGSAVWHAGNFTPSNYSLTSHTHTTSQITNLSSYTGFDARYYTESEVNALISGFVSVTSGSFTASLRNADNGTSYATGTAYWRKIGNVVTLFIPFLQSSSATTTLVVDDIPSSIRPAYATSLVCWGRISGLWATIVAALNPSWDYFNLYQTDGGAFPSATGHAIQPTTFTYICQ